MNIGERLETIGRQVPAGSVLADIGTDHAYLPVWLLQQGRISRAVAGDIAAGPCMAARTTIAIHGLKDRVEVRQGSGLEVLQPGEADCIVIAGMGGSTISSILAAAPEIARSAKLLVLQPMAGAAGLRQWLTANGWQLTDEELVDDPPHFYEIICAEPGQDKAYSAAEYAVGPVLLRKGHRLLAQQLTRQINSCRQLLQNMERSPRARAGAKYRELQALLAALEVLQG